MLRIQVRQWGVRAEACVGAVELAEGGSLSGSVSKVRMRDVRLTDNHLILDVSVLCSLTLSVRASGD